MYIFWPKIITQWTYQTQNFNVKLLNVNLTNGEADVYLTSLLFVMSVTLNVSAAGHLKVLQQKGGKGGPILGVVGGWGRRVVSSSIADLGVAPGLSIPAQDTITCNRTIICGLDLPIRLCNRSHIQCTGS